MNIQYSVLSGDTTLNYPVWGSSFTGTNRIFPFCTPYEWMKLKEDFNKASKQVNGHSIHLAMCLFASE